MVREYDDVLCSLGIVPDAPIEKWPEISINGGCVRWTKYRRREHDDDYWITTEWKWARLTLLCSPRDNRIDVYRVRLFKRTKNRVRPENYEFILRSTIMHIFLLAADVLVDVIPQTCGSGTGHLQGDYPEYQGERAFCAI